MLVECTIDTWEDVSALEFAYEKMYPDRNLIFTSEYTDDPESMGNRLTVMVQAESYEEYLKLHHDVFMRAIEMIDCISISSNLIEAFKAHKNGDF